MPSSVTGDGVGAASLESSGQNAPITRVSNASGSGTNEVTAPIALMVAMPLTLSSGVPYSPRQRLTEAVPFMPVSKTVMVDILGSVPVKPS